MNSLFEDDLITRLETEFDVVKVWDQRSLKDLLLLEGVQYYNFPMLSFEYTPDSNEMVGIAETKFFNDSSHRGTWICGGTEDDILFIVNVQSFDNVLEIDAFEVNKNSRNEGIGGNVVSIIESVAEKYFNEIRLSPFDTDAMNFWEHMEYVESKNGHWVKEL